MGLTPTAIILFLCTLCLCGCSYVFCSAHPIIFRKTSPVLNNADEVKRSIKLSNYDWGCNNTLTDADFSPLLNYLWCNSLDLAEAAYNTTFIQGILKGLLNPVDYSKYDIQDIVYLYKVHTIYNTICDANECSEELESFFTREGGSYLKYAVYGRKTYHLRRHSIKATDPVKSYVAFQKDTAANYDPQYGVVMMVPCMLLWPKLAERLKSEGAISDTNPFSFWVEDNLGYGTAITLANQILNNTAYEFDSKVSLEIFREGMQQEINFFAWATEPEI